MSHIDESYDDSSHESSHKRTNDESSQNHFVNSRCPQVSHTSIRPALRGNQDELQSTSNNPQPQREQLLIRSRAAVNPVNVVFQPIQSQGQPRLQPDPGQRSSQGQTQGHIWERGGGGSDEQFPVKYIQSSNQSYQNNPTNHFNPSIRILGPGGGQLRSTEVNGTHLFRPPRPKDERTILQRR